MSKHTPGRLHVVPQYTGCNGEEVSAGVFDDDDGSPNLMIGEFCDRPDAERAVACWNALIGVPDPAALGALDLVMVSDLLALADRVIEIFGPMQADGRCGHTFERLLNRALKVKAKHQAAIDLAVPLTKGA